MSCTVLIVAKNEENNIQDCIASCRPFADEIIVIDDFSSDRTPAIATSCGARVIQRALNGDWGSQQTFGIQQATKNWIFLIDADERCLPETAAEIAQIVQTTPDRAYKVRRLNHFRRRMIKHGSLSPDWVIRLLPREGTSVVGLVHQKIVFSCPLHQLKGSLLHFTYYSWAQLEGKMQKYARLAAMKYHEEGKKSHFVLDVTLRPLFSFFKMYVLKLGFLDGALGFALALNYADYTLSKYFQLHELEASD